MWLLTAVAVTIGFVFGWISRARIPRHVWDHDSIALGYWIATAQGPADEALDGWFDEVGIRSTCRASTWTTYQKVTQ